MHVSHTKTTLTLLLFLILNGSSWPAGISLKKKSCTTHHFWWTSRAVDIRQTLLALFLPQTMKPSQKIKTLSHAFTASLTLGLFLKGDNFEPYKKSIYVWSLLCTFYRYDFSETIANIVASVVIPNGIFLVSLIILLYWYCPYCQARCKKYEEQMDQDEKEDQ